MSEDDVSGARAPDRAGDAGNGLDPPDPELAPRYAPGEDVRPLLRAVGGGAAGVAAALLLDRVLPTSPGRPWLWPGLAADAAVGAPGATVTGVAIVAAVAVIAAVVFAYGQFRRFVPARPVIAGLVWSALAWLVAAPVLLPRAAVWLGPGSAAASPQSASALLGPAALLVAESLATFAVWGALVGWANPGRVP
jgi:hypothetical protein